MDRSSRIIVSLLALLHCGCRIGGQMSEMMQSSDGSNNNRLRTSSPLILVSTPAWHTRQTQPPDHSVATDTSAMWRQSETSLQMPVSQRTTTHSVLQQKTTDSNSLHTTVYSTLQERSENLQHVASSYVQTTEPSWHTRKYSPSASVQSDLSSEHSMHAETSSTSLVSAPFSFTEQSTAPGVVETQPAGGFSSHTSVSSLRDVREEQFTHWSSYSTIPVTHQVVTESSQISSTAIKSDSLDERSTSFQQSHATSINTELLIQSSATVSHHLASSQSVPTATEPKLLNPTSFHQLEISTSTPIEEFVTSQVMQHIQSSQIQTSQSSGEVIPTTTAHSITETVPLPTDAGAASAVGGSETIMSSPSADIQQSGPVPSVIHTTLMSQDATHSFVRTSSITSGFIETSRIHATASVTSPPTESHITELASSTGVFVYSTGSPVHVVTVSYSTVFRDNSSILVNAPAAGVSKPAASTVSDSDRYASETQAASIAATETSSYNVTTHTIAHVSESATPQSVVSSLSRTEAETLNSSYVISTEMKETPSLYNTSVTQTVSVARIVNQTETHVSTVLSTTAQQPAISPSSVFSELTSSSVLHRNITPTLVYQSENTTHVSKTSDTSFIHPSTTQTTSSVYNVTTTTHRVLLEIRDVRFLFKFHGDCHLIQNNSLLFNEFLLGLVDILSKSLTLQKSMIKLDRFSCRPVTIYATLVKVSYHNVSQTLRNMIEKNTFTVKVNIQGHIATFEAVHVEEVPLLKDAPAVFDLPEEGLDKVDIIVIIVACCICGVLLSIGGILCVKECYRRKYAQSFDLMEVPHVNLKLEDFTLTRIPRAKAIYNDDSVTMQSYTDSYGQHVAKGSDSQVKSNNGMHVRMNENTDGIVIGVVGTSRKNGHSNGKKAKWRSSASSENSAVANPSMENLLPSSSDSHTTDGASNPVFVNDDDDSPACSSVSKNS